LQKRATPARQARQDQAVAFHRLEAKRLHSHNVSTIVHFDRLHKVARMIDDMGTELKNQQTDEVLEWISTLF